MKHISFDTYEKICENRLFDQYFKSMRIGVLDIETTGLDPAGSRFILGGLHDVKEGKFHQIFAEDTGEETEALGEFRKLLEPLDVVITYNGIRFDMPFIRERAKRCGISGMPEPYDLDIYRVVRYHSPIRKFVPNLRQKTLENYMGLWQDRTDEISGAESVELYMEYVRNREPEIEEKILLHNSDDVRQLTRLTGVISKCDFHSAMHHLGFPLPDMGLVVDEIKVLSRELVIAGTQGNDPVEIRAYSMSGNPADIAFGRDDKSFRIVIPLIQRQGVTAADLRAAGLCEDEFDKYPTSGSGFLVVKENEQIKYMECNHLAKACIRKVIEETL